VVFVLIMSIIRKWILRRANKSTESVKEFVGKDWQDSPLVEYGVSCIELNGIGVPNTMGIFRLVAGPAVLFIYLTQWFGGFSNWAAFWLWLIAFLTDAGDGTVAWILGEKTEFGRIFDPVADKSAQYLPFLGLIAYCAMAGKMSILVPSAIVLVGLVAVLARDVVLIAVFGLKRCREQSPNIIDKIRAGIMAIYVGEAAISAAVGVMFVKTFILEIVGVMAGLFSILSLVLKILSINKLMKGEKK